MRNLFSLILTALAFTQANSAFSQEPTTTVRAGYGYEWNFEGKSLGAQLETTNPDYKLKRNFPDIPTTCFQKNGFQHPYNKTPSKEWMQDYMKKSLRYASIMGNLSISCNGQNHDIEPFIEVYQDGKWKIKTSFNDKFYNITILDYIKFEFRDEKYFKLSKRGDGKDGFELRKGADKKPFVTCIIFNSNLDCRYQTDGSQNHDDLLFAFQSVGLTTKSSENQSHSVVVRLRKMDSESPFRSISKGFTDVMKGFGLKSGLSADRKEISFGDRKPQNWRETLAKEYFD